ncbi:cell wall-binding repeat-containing protein [Leifsonia sp. NPDC058248]|uniref:cell wall-binding repeat-containing protein n=1 Tax=Leifsonia sp. NPDC058248 TaxID=3346402 RepID=UPI0036D82100
MTIAAVLAGTVLGAAPANAVTQRAAIVGTVTVPAGGDAFAAVPALAVDAGTNTLYALQSGSVHSSLSVVDLTSNAVSKTLPLPKVPADVAIDTARALVYVSGSDINAGTGIVSVFSAATRALVATIPLGVFGPSSFNGVAGIGVDTATGSIYVAGMAGPGGAATPGLRVLTASQITAAIGGTAVTPTAIALPSGNQVAVVVDSAAGIVYATGAGFSSSSLFTISTTSNTLTGTIPLAGIPSTAAVDRGTGTVYVSQHSPSGTSNSVAVVLRGAAAVSATIAVPAGVQSLDVDATAGTLYAALAQPYEGGRVNELVTISTATKSILSTTPLPTPADVAVSAMTRTAYVSGASSGDTTISAVRLLGVDRVAGSNRYATSVAVSQREFPGTAPIVYVASGANYPDALAAGPAAVKRHGPLLLTTPGALPGSVAAEVARLKPSTIVVAGGPASVSDRVLAQLRTAAPGANVSRAAGSDRFATSRAVVAGAFTTANTVYLASGLNFPDALSAGSAAGAKGAPILLVNGGASTVDRSTALLLSSLKVKNIALVGGTVVVSAGLAASLTHAGYAVTRLAGPTRYGTAESVNAKTYTHASTAIIATGAGFPDAMSATSWAGMTSSPLYLAPSGCVPRGVLVGLGHLGAGTVTVIGGTAVLTTKVADLVPCAWY